MRATSCDTSIWLPEATTANVSAVTLSGVAPARVAILGGGVSGINAAQMAVGLRADVTIYDISTSRLAEIDEMFAGRVKTVYSSKAAIAACSPVNEDR